MISQATSAVSPSSRITVRPQCAERITHVPAGVRGERERAIRDHHAIRGQYARTICSPGIMLSWRLRRRSQNAHGVTDRLDNSELEKKRDLLPASDSQITWSEASPG
jgi:hypothetical protein